VPVAPEAPVPSAEEVKSRLDKLYSRPPKLLILIVSSVAMFMLGWAVFLQLRSAENYWYQPMVSIYSLLAGLFVVSRFLIAALYLPPKDVGYVPSVTVLVPCMNEGAVIRQTIERIFSAGYALDKLEVVCVNDGSTDNTLEQMLAAQSRHPRRVVVDFERNRGLCHAWGGLDADRARRIYGVRGFRHVYFPGFAAQTHARFCRSCGRRNFRSLRRRKRECQPADAHAGCALLFFL